MWCGVNECEGDGVNECEDGAVNECEGYGDGVGETKRFEHAPFCLIFWTTLLN